MVFFIINKNITFIIGEQHKSYQCCPDFEGKSFHSHHIYCTTASAFQGLSKQLKKKDVLTRLIDEKQVRRTFGFPLELGISNLGELERIRNPSKIPIPRKTSLVKQIQTLIKRPKIKVALVNGLGAALGDSLIGLTALRVTRQIFEQNFEQIQFDAWIRMDTIKRLIPVYRQSQLIDNFYDIPINLSTFLKYDAYFDFSGLISYKTFDRLPMVDFFLENMGIDSETISVKEKRNRVNLHKQINQEIIQKLNALVKNREILLFHPQTSATVRSIPEVHHTDFIEYFIDNTHYFVISVSNLKFEHPRFKDITDWSKSFEHLCAIIAHTQAIICADTVIYHIADAFNIPTVALFSTINPKLRIAYYSTVSGILVPGAQDSPYYGRHKSHSKIPTETVEKLWKNLHPSEILSCLRQLTENHIKTISILPYFSPKSGGQTVSPQPLSILIKQGIDFYQKNEFSAAEKIFKNIYHANPRQVDALYWLGVLAAKRNDSAMAESFLQQAIEIKPQDIFYRSLGLFYLGQGKFTQSQQAFQQALNLNTQDFISLTCLGQLTEKQGKIEDALNYYQRSLNIQPHSEAYGNMGRLFRSQGNLDLALACFQAGVKLSPNNAHLQNDMGDIFVQQNQWDKALTAFQESIRLNPQFFDALNNIGVAYEHQNQVDLALQFFERALKVKPDSAEVLGNLGLLYTTRRQFDKAFNCYQRGFDSEPNCRSLIFKRAYPAFLLGRFEQAWQDYEARLDFNPRSMPSVRGERWDGKPLNGRTLLIHYEQGLGDTIQFSRYISLIPKDKGKIIFACQKEVHCLFDNFPAIDELIEGNLQTQPNIQYDIWVPLLSLPYIFGTTLNNIPAQIPYLFPNAERIKKWQQFLSNQYFKIGLVWAGKATHLNDKNRSCNLMQFAPLANLPDVIFYSLQKDKFSEQIEPKGLNLIRLSDKLKDFADTAAVLMCLDLVITVDTATAHLAGALGRPVWNLLPFEVDWRWMVDRIDSPWYPTMRLFRQPTSGDWHSVFQTVRQALFEKLDEKKRLTQFSNQINILLQNALQAYKNNQLDHAKTLFHQVLAYHANQADALYWLGVLSERMNELQDVESYLQKAIQQYPRDVFYRSLGLFYFRQEREIMWAQQLLQHALALNPEDFIAMTCLGQLFEKQDKIESALYYYQKSLNIQPHVEAYGNLGKLLRSQKRFEEALYYFREGLKISPNNKYLRDDIRDTMARQTDSCIPIPHST